MVDIQSKEVIDKISDELKLQPAMQIPRALAEKIQLVYNVNPKSRNHTAFTAQRIVNGTTTMTTLPTDRQFFVTSFSLSNQSDAVADNIQIILVATPLGRGQAVLATLSKLSLTAYSGEIVVTLAEPMPLEPGSLITVGSTFTVGASNSAAGCTGFFTDPQ